MTWVKVCGMTTPEAIDAANEAGADAIGLVMDPESTRHLAPPDARVLAERVSPGIEIVLVTRHADPGDVLSWADSIGATMVQPHGDQQLQAAEAASALGLAVLMPGPADLQPGWRRLVDNPIPGSGETLDWDDLSGLGGEATGEWVLAGGLSPSNVASAVARAKPWGVDASSGLESAPGLKDPELIKSFVSAARS